MQEDDSIQMQELEDFNSDVECLAELLMRNAETKITDVLRQSDYCGDSSGLTRADISNLCNTDEFNNVFYKMAEKIVKKCNK